MITGRLESGKLKVGQEVEGLGYNKTAKAKVNGIETQFLMFQLFTSASILMEKSRNSVKRRTVGTVRRTQTVRVRTV